MTKSKKVKAGLITAGCGIFLLAVYSSIEKESGNKAKAWIYDRLATDGSFDKDKMVTWLVQSKLVATAKEAEQSIREVLENMNPRSKNTK